MVLSCSGKPSAPAHPTGGSANGSSQSSGSATAVASGRSDEQCDKLIAHAVALGAAERPADQKPTDDERAAMQSQLRTSYAPKCKQMTSKGYDCALAAHTLAELEACGG